MKRISSIFAAAALCAPLLFGQRAERAEQSRAAVERMTRPAAVTDSARALVRAKLAQGRSKAMVRATTSRDAASPAATQDLQAPGVTQVNLFDLSREAYFVVTEPLKTGTTLQFYLTMGAEDSQNSQELAFWSREVTEEIPVGFSFYLPALRQLGDFWKGGLTAYTVVVTLPDGTQTSSSFDFPTGGYRRVAGDMQYISPRIESWREFIDGNGNNIVELKGLFLTGVKTYVVFEDQVAPANAIAVVDANTIQVNLNALPNFDTGAFLSYNLTVGQGEWSDVLAFRHTPR